MSRIALALVVLAFATSSFAQDAAATAAATRMPSSVGLRAAAGLIAEADGMDQLQRDISSLAPSDLQKLVGLGVVPSGGLILEYLGIIVKGTVISATLFASPSTCKIKTYYSFKEWMSGKRLQQQTKTTSSGQTRSLRFPKAKFIGHAVLWIMNASSTNCFVALISPQLT